MDGDAGQVEEIAQHLRHVVGGGIHATGACCGLCVGAFDGFVHATHQAAALVLCRRQSGVLQAEGLRRLLLEELQITHAAGGGDGVAE